MCSLYLPLSSSLFFFFPNFQGVGQPLAVDGSRVFVSVVCCLDADTSLRPGTFISLQIVTKSICRLPQGAILEAFHQLWMGLTLNFDPAANCQLCCRANAERE